MEKFPTSRHLTIYETHLKCCNTCKRASEPKKMCLVGKKLKELAGK
jgi:hypothetical protein